MKNSEETKEPAKNECQMPKGVITHVHIGPEYYGDRPNKPSSGLFVPSEVQANRELKAQKIGLNGSPTQKAKIESYYRKLNKDVKPITAQPEASKCTGNLLCSTVSNSLVFYACKWGNTFKTSQRIKEVITSEKAWLLLCLKTKEPIRIQGKTPQVGDVVSDINGKKLLIIFCNPVNLV